MKKVYIILIILASIGLLILVLGFYKFNFTNDDMYNADGTKIDSINKVEEIKTDGIGGEKPYQITNGTRCFYRDQIATKEAPYKVHEDIVLNIKDGTVTGTKKGNQAGPDMTNGFWGDLNGSVKNDLLELVYSYTVDGSSGKELEVYNLKENLLERNFWPTTEKNHILTPDRTGAPRIIPYLEKECLAVATPTPAPTPAPTNPTNPIACTMDAKLCPDGTYVGRTGPKCEFICPN